MTSSPLIAALTATAIFAASVPASAQVVRFDPTVIEAASPFMTDVQFRGGHGMRRFHGGRFGQRGFGGGRRFGGGGYGYRGGRGAAIGAGVAGLAAGALIGGAIASQAAPAYGYGYGAPAYAGDPGYAYAPVAPGGDTTAYCSQRFKSYDPSSGTYLGYDGDRHPCP